MRTRVLIALAVSVAAAPGATAGSIGPQVPSGGAIAQHDQGSPVLDASAGAGSLGPDVHVLIDPARAPGSEPEGQPATMADDVQAAGDLDGDGIDDVFTLYRDRLVARDGATGDALWRFWLRFEEDLPYHAWWFSADLAGDARLETVLVRMWRSWNCSCVAGYGLTRDASPVMIQVLDSADGAVVSSILVAGRSDRLETPVAGAGLGHSDIFEGLRVMPDANGDGLADLLIRTLEASPHGGVLGTMTGRAYSGADGSVIGSVTAAATPTGFGVFQPWVEAVADVSGDGLGDVVALEQRIDGPALFASTLDGKTLWRRPGVDGYAAEVAVLGAAKRPAVVVGGGGAFTAYDAVDGAVLWSIDSPPPVVEDLNGDGGADVVGMAELEAASSGRQRVAVVAREGLSLEELWTVVVEQPDTDGHDWWVWISEEADDLDGDGTLDLLFFDEVGYGDSGSPLDPGDESMSWEVRALSGRTGSQLWRTSSEARQVRPTVLSGDVNGSGSGDVSVIAASAGSPDGYVSLSVSILDGATLEDLGRVDVVRRGYGMAGKAFGADLDGDGDDELVVFAAWYRGRSSPRRVLAYQPDGTLLWAV